MQLLTYSSLYPSSAQSQHGVFVENRLRHISALKGFETRVVAPVPWFPFAGAKYGRYGGYASIAGREERFGIDVEAKRRDLGLSIEDVELEPADVAWHMAGNQSRHLCANGLSVHGRLLVETKGLPPSKGGRSLEG